ncbi:MAG: hypothetical protein MJ231_09040 [bacterium]|nr:hypothetical protein [bacterium]
MSFQKTVYFYYHFDKDKALPPLSFVMIGLSQNSDGRFDQEIRSSILEHLEQGDINEYAQSSIKEQIKSFTPASFIKFLYKKLLILYCSGNFCLPIP